MKTIGILGGLGPEATVDYYKEIIKGFDKINDNDSLNYPEIVIYSVTMSKFIGLLEDKKYDKAADYLAQCLNHIKNSGADFAAISANTPHLLFDEIQAKVDLPLISITETCAQEVANRNIRKCGLIGTKFTMENDFYQKAFNKYGIEITVPEKDDIQLIHKKLFSELELGVFKEDTKREILRIVSNLNEKEGVESVILGCTEFPLMFKEKEYLGLPFLNTSQLHVHAIIEECLK
ncbi:aspartate/glutamate racemase family protein [Sunxiuqinia sp. A32]|uniref:aspartate/glutamate racemase family protein n=1 Tax=Sunxiuqinia sp. A32 TaxID=3461496 RepID=UPI004045E861